ncbi:hypothetical protein GVAV_000738 [Gurleya vavrai]
MKFEDFLKKAKEDKFDHKMIDNYNFITKEGRFIQIEVTEDLNYEDFLKKFEKNSKDNFNFIDEDIFRIGDQDLFPDTRIGGSRRNGMFVDPEHPIFGEREIRRDGGGDLNVPYMAKFDPIVPEPLRKNKNKKRGNDPDPDHFQKPGGDNDYFM